MVLYEKSGVAEKYVMVVKNMYYDSVPVVRCAEGITEFQGQGRGGIPPGIDSEPFLVCSCNGQINRWDETRVSVDNDVCGRRCIMCREPGGNQTEFERWRCSLERKGVKISRSKT